MLPTRVQALCLPLFSLACALSTSARQVSVTFDDSNAPRSRVILDYTVLTSRLSGPVTATAARTHLPRADGATTLSASGEIPASTHESPSPLSTPSSFASNIAPDPDSSSSLATSLSSLTSTSSTTPANSPSVSAVPGKARDTTLAVALPISILLLLLLITLVLWWRRHSQARFLPPGRRISEDPTLSGWARDAWALKRSEAGSLSRGHLNGDHDDSPRTSPTTLIRHVRNATGVLGRPRGLTASSAATTICPTQSPSQSNDENSALGQPMAVLHFPPSNYPDMHREDTLGYGHSTHARHPYAARTPGPYEGRPLPFVPDQLATPGQSSALVHQKTPRALPAIPLRSPSDGSMLAGVTQKTARRPLPVPPIPEKQPQNMGLRSFFKTASGSYLSS